MTQRNVKPMSKQHLARRAELAAAIRSGDYTRATGRLEFFEGGSPRHCCLGVACRVAAKHHVKLNDRSDFPGAPSTLIDVYLTGAGGQQPNVARYYGLTQHEQRELAKLNDNHNDTGGFVTSWDEIAQHIEVGDLR